MAEISNRLRTLQVRYSSLAPGSSEAAFFQAKDSTPPDGLLNAQELKGLNKGQAMDIFRASASPEVPRAAIVPADIDLESLRSVVENRQKAVARAWPEIAKNHQFVLFGEEVPNMQQPSAAAFLGHRLKIFADAGFAELALAIPTDFQTLVDHFCITGERGPLQKAWVAHARHWPLLEAARARGMRISCIGFGESTELPPYAYEGRKQFEVLEQRFLAQSPGTKVLLFLSPEFTQKSQHTGFLGRKVKRLSHYLDEHALKNNHACHSTLLVESGDRNSDAVELLLSRTMAPANVLFTESPELRGIICDYAAREILGTKFDSITAVLPENQEPPFLLVPHLARKKVIDADIARALKHVDPKIIALLTKYYDPDPIAALNIYLAGPHGSQALPQSPTEEQLTDLADDLGKGTRRFNFTYEDLETALAKNLVFDLGADGRVEFVKPEANTELALDAIELAEKKQQEVIQLQLAKQFYDYLNVNLTPEEKALVRHYRANAYRYVGGIYESQFAMVIFGAASELEITKSLPDPSTHPTLISNMVTTYYTERQDEIEKHLKPYLEK